MTSIANCGNGYESLLPWARQIHVVLLGDGLRVSEKVIRRLTRERGLAVIGPKKRHYNAYHGEMGPALANIVQRNFHADAPNTKSVTDITGISDPGEKGLPIGHHRLL